VSIRQNRIEGSNPSRSAISHNLRSPAAVAVHPLFACRRIFVGSWE
jgi:hypothetical protein